MALEETMPEHTGALQRLFEVLLILRKGSKTVQNFRHITEKCQICVTGSSAKMLSKELATVLGGRALPQEVFPYSFSKFLKRANYFIYSHHL